MCLIKINQALVAAVYDRLGRGTIRHSSNRRFEVCSIAEF